MSCTTETAALTSSRCKNASTRSGAALAEDDDFGDETLHAVLQFQRAEGLTPDGVVGAATWAALDSPTTTVVWEDPDIPTEHATDAPAGTVPETPTPTSTPPLVGDAAVG